MLNPPCWPRIMKMDNGTKLSPVFRFGVPYVEPLVSTFQWVFHVEPGQSYYVWAKKVDQVGSVDPELLEMQIYGE